MDTGVFIVYIFLVSVIGIINFNICTVIQYFEIFWNFF